MRMTGTSLDCYKYLEPLLNDYRKVRVQNKMGGRSTHPPCDQLVVGDRSTALPMLLP